MYRYDPDAVDARNVNTRFWHMIHQLAVTAAACYPNRVSLCLTAEEVAARERKAQCQ